MKKIVMQILNYLFPPESYQGRKITETRWFQKLNPVAPYTVVSIIVFILLWGLIFPHPTRFFLTPQFIVLLGIAFWMGLISIVVKLLRKRQRDPAFFLVIATFIAVRGLFTLIIFSTVQPMLKDAKVEMELEKQQISHEVQDKLSRSKEQMDDISELLHKRVQEHQARVNQAFSQLDSRMESRFDRFRRHDQENTQALWKIIEKNKEQHKIINANFLKSVAEGQERVNQRKRAWCRSHSSLSQMCNGLPPEEPDTSKVEEPKEVENATYIDLPLDFKYTLKE